jgi:hypothetical protein
LHASRLRVALKRSVRDGHLPTKHLATDIVSRDVARLFLQAGS